MPEITPQDKFLKYLAGRHLWHAPLSSCSQRVRLVLAEVGLSFESHVLNLEAGEHATESYQAIHPDGVVPAYLHDGRLFIESIDIINYIANGAFGGVSPEEADLLDRANGAQQDLKLLTFEFLFRSKPLAADEDAKRFQQSHKNAWLRQFYKDFAVGFDRQRIADAITRTQHGFEVLNGVLDNGLPFLSGDQFGLADIAWLPNVHRMDLMGWPIENLSALQAWFDTVRTRPSYEQALLAWEDEDVAGVFRNYTKMRRSEGTDVRSFLTSVLGEDRSQRDVG